MVRLRLVTILTLGALIMPFQPARAYQEPQMTASVQRFEYGLMYSFSGQASPALWHSVQIITSEGQWLGFEATDVQVLPDSPDTDLPPTGYFKPADLFGKIWGNIPAIRGTLGWAVEAARQVVGGSAGCAAGTCVSALSDGSQLFQQGYGAFYPWAVKFFTLDGSSIKAGYAWGQYVAHDGTNLLKPGVRRIQFARGAVSGSAIGVLSFGDPKATFILRAFAGQQMTISLLTCGPDTASTPDDGVTDVPTIFTYSPDKVSSAVTGPDGATIASAAQSTGTIFDGRLPQTGDYVISLGKAGDPAPGGVSYTLYEVTITIVD